MHTLTCPPYSASTCTHPPVFILLSFIPACFSPFLPPTLSGKTFGPSLTPPSQNLLMQSGFHNTKASLFTSWDALLVYKAKALTHDHLLHWEDDAFDAFRIIYYYRMSKWTRKLWKRENVSYNDDPLMMLWWLVTKKPAAWRGLCWWKKCAINQAAPILPRPSVHSSPSMVWGLWALKHIITRTEAAHGASSDQTDMIIFGKTAVTIRLSGRARTNLRPPCMGKETIDGFGGCAFIWFVHSWWATGIGRVFFLWLSRQ